MALNAPFQAYENFELYSSIQSYVNNIEVNASNQDTIDLGLGIASGKYHKEYIIDWIIDHSSS